MKSLFKITALLVLLLVLSTSNIYSQKPFTVVIDAGHGGHDTGATGRFSKEKNINLAVSKKLGNLISENYPDVKVVYTRTTDVFLTLQERADIVNRNKADIFFCIHTNATGGASANGTETYILGLHKTKSNLEVAMSENSVMTLEEDYQTRYEGFDPNSVDSYIIFELMQDKYLDQSLRMASLIENQFRKASRYSRGVRQAGFWVLHKSAAPSVLVELGFISNPSEERFLNTENGKDQLSKAIFNAFEIYKRDYDKKSGKTLIPKDIPVYKADKADSVEQDKVVYKIQLFALEKKIRPNSHEFKKLADVDYFREGNYYKYTYGEEFSFKKIEALRKTIAGKFPNAYIIAFKGNQKITIGEALKKE
ncbi:MAG: N-acetylmuramoyl-L-alanine amidase family protein [Paludibacteraceae bacterium]